MKKLLLYTLLVFLILAIIAPIWFFRSGYSFMFVNRPLDTNNLVIEGWISPLALETLAERIQDEKVNTIYITGIDKPSYTLMLIYRPEKHERKDKPVNLNTKSILIIPVPDSINAVSRIGVYVSGDKVKRGKAHFSLFLDDHKLGSSFAGWERSLITFPELTEQKNARYITIFFDNDAYAPDNDRNLRVYGLEINDNYYPVFSDATEKIEEDLPFTPHTDLLSDAYSTMAYLEDLGIEAEKMIPVIGEQVRNNKTLSSAKAVRKEVGKKEIDAFNVVSQGVHSRRTLTIYKKKFRFKSKVGVIAFEDPDLTEKNWKNTNEQKKEVMKEFLQYVFVKIFVY